MGNVAGSGLHSPDASVTSIGFIPAAASLMRTWPGQATGVARSMTTGDAPYALTVTARTIFSFDPPRMSRSGAVSALARPFSQPQIVIASTKPIVGRRLRRCVLPAGDFAPGNGK